MAYQFYSWFLGVVLLICRRTQSQHQGVQSERLLGVFFGLLSSRVMQTHSWIMKNLIHKGINSRAAMGVIFGISAVLLLPTLLITAITYLIIQIIFG